MQSIKQETKKIFDGINAECAVFEVAEEGEVAVWEFFFTVAGLEKDGIDIATITPGTIIKVSGTLGETLIPKLKKHTTLKLQQQNSRKPRGRNGSASGFLCIRKSTPLQTHWKPQKQGCFCVCKSQKIIYKCL